ncbi:hypothetical protein [Sphingomonas sp. DT-51]|uniref:hypothetical protein n=1 Tax=Sphingomonas sp. DT-51 TaxID=3396165 RepID=UPI003F53EC1D
MIDPDERTRGSGRRKESGSKPMYRGFFHRARRRETIVVARRSGSGLTHPWGLYLAQEARWFDIVFSTEEEAAALCRELEDAAASERWWRTILWCCWRRLHLLNREDQRDRSG